MMNENENSVNNTENTAAGGNRRHGNRPDRSFRPNRHAQGARPGGQNIRTRSGAFITPGDGKNGDSPREKRPESVGGISTVQKTAQENAGGADRRNVQNPNNNAGGRRENGNRGGNQRNASNNGQGNGQNNRRFAGAQPRQNQNGGNNAAGGETAAKASEISAADTGNRIGGKPTAVPAVTGRNPDAVSPKPGEPDPFADLAIGWSGEHSPWKEDAYLCDRGTEKQDPAAVAEALAYANSLLDAEGPLLFPDSAVRSQTPQAEGQGEGEEETVEIVGVRFVNPGKSYSFSPKGKKYEKGDFVVVETARGVEYGEVWQPNRSVPASQIVLPLRPVLRRADKSDAHHEEENRKEEEKAFEICRNKIAQHKLAMKLLKAQYTFDNSKLLFYFISDGRVDFRELVKDLAGTFHTRIELRQVGIRDEAKLLGGLGACGRVLCCAAFLPDFAQVSIKMAKEQGLSLNSSKISGVCGRLMCCLHYEAEAYEAEIRLTPTVDSVVDTPDGRGTVVGTSPLRGLVTVRLAGEEATVKQYSRNLVKVLRAGTVPAAEDKDEEADKQ